MASIYGSGTHYSEYVNPRGQTDRSSQEVEIHTLPGKKGTGIFSAGRYSQRSVSLSNEKRQMMSDGFLQ